MRAECAPNARRSRSAPKCAEARRASGRVARLRRELGELRAKLGDDATKRAPRSATSPLSAAVGARRTETNSRLGCAAHEQILGNGSLFFGRKPAMSYTTSPA